MNIIVIGAGYVGVTTAVVLAQKGHRVRLFEQDPHRLSRLRSGKVPFFEPGLQQAYQRAQGLGLSVGRRPEKAVLAGADLAFVCVGTPLKNGRLDTAWVQKAVLQLRGLAKDGVLAVKSTVPVGFCKSLRKHFSRVAFVPEFLRQGTALEDAQNPERVVVGSESPEALERLKELYAPNPLIAMGEGEAELVKLAGNGYLALRLGYFGQLADLCGRLGLDYCNVARAMGLDGRIGGDYMDVGGGFGGSCLPKDTAALWRQSLEAGCEMGLLKGALEANDQHKRRLAAFVEGCLDGAAGRRIAVLSPRFKAGTDDARNSPSVDVAQLLLARGAEIAFGEDVTQALKQADCALVISGHEELHALPAQKLKELMRRPLVIDVGGQLDGGALIKAGVEYQRAGGSPSKQGEGN